MWQCRLLSLLFLRLLSYFELTSKNLTAAITRYLWTLFSDTKEPVNSTWKFTFALLQPPTSKTNPPWCSAFMRDGSRSVYGVEFRISLDVGRCKPRRKTYLRLSVSVTQAWLLRAPSVNIVGRYGPPSGQHPEVCASNSSSLTEIRSLDLCK